MVRDQRRHSLRERAIIGGQLERADLQTFVDDRHGDRFALLTDGEPDIETVATRKLYPCEGNPSRAKRFQHPRRTSSASPPRLRIRSTASSAPR